MNGKGVRIKWPPFHDDNIGRRDNGFHSDGGSVKMWAALYGVQSPSEIRSLGMAQCVMEKV